MLVKIALNGARSKGEHQFIPQTLTEIDKDVRLLYKHGCRVFHIHCYDDNGEESLKPRDVNNLVNLVKNVSKEIQLGISSGDWIEPDFGKRKGLISNWKLIPDFISVNMIEDGAIEISELLLSKGIKIEAGLNEEKAAKVFVNSDISDKCFRVLIEPEPEILTSAISEINKIELVLDKAQINTPKLLHGFNSVVWDLIREAKKRGYDTRIGLEDTIYLKNGILAENNLELYQHAYEILNKSIS